MRDMRWGENVLGNPETFSARMHIGHKEERRYGRGQCHDHVGIIRCVCTSNERSKGVPGSWSSLLRDRYNATVLSRPARSPLVVPRGRNFSTASRHRARTSGAAEG